MTITPMALKAYSAAGNLGSKTASARNMGTKEATRSFAATIQDSLGKVNEMQMEKTAMIQDFATGKNQNVHELMISLQKAGLAMDMTAAVRNKVMQAYQELMRLQF
jgi:flagellar hook-basal body complex protein FliE